MMTKRYLFLVAAVVVTGCNAEDGSGLGGVEGTWARVGADAIELTASAPIGGKRLLNLAGDQLISSGQWIYIRSTAAAP